MATRKRDVWFWTEAMYDGSCELCGEVFVAESRIAYNAAIKWRSCERCGLKMSPAPEGALTVLGGCPRATCRASGDEPCVDRQGRVRKRWHAGRQRLAETAWGRRQTEASAPLEEPGASS